MKKLSLSLACLALCLGVSCREPAQGVSSLLPSGQAPGHVAPAPATTLESVSLDGVPFVKQKPDFCGEACVAMAAARLGKKYDQDAVFAASEVDPALGRGAYTKELLHAVRKLGFEPGEAWSTIDARDPTPGLESAFAAVHADLGRGVPTIVCMHYDDRPSTTEHFRLIVGYDKAADELVYHEPAEADGGYRRMSRALFFKLWPLQYAADRWTLIRIPLAPGGALADPPKPRGFSPADYAQHVMALRERLKGHGLGGLNVRIEAPFVVVGDDAPDVLAQRAQTVSWSVEHLEKDFFDKRPERILDVYLFKDAGSYERGVLTLTGEAPTTPYGFYSSTRGGLFMNISTGGGTLVHEIVHPYVEADFPDAPAWLNEGLGSLFEQSAEQDGRIVGLTNWRLAGLQRALRRGPIPSFKELASMSDRAFYDAYQGTNYAQARYLFYYLQQHGLLVPFYEAFRANRTKDPTGYATLSSTLKEPDMAAFQKRWEAYVQGLRFER